MNKTEIIKKLNQFSRNVNEYIPLLSEFLILEHPDKSKVIIDLVMSQPLLLSQTIPKVINYYLNKYNILTLKKDNNVILYYE